MTPRPAPTEPDPFRRLVAIMERLLEPGGCPWDREQNHESLKPYVIEEAYEVCEAIDDDNMADLREELGDLVLQVVFHAALARREKHFAIDDVLTGICDKLIRRHPHVFGDVEVDGSGQVLRNWEQIKQQEKQEKAEAARRRRGEAAAGKTSRSESGPGEAKPEGEAGSQSTAEDREADSHGLSAGENHGVVDDEPVASVLDGVPRALPALTRATRVQEKAARVGFDWDRIDDVWKKVEEEVGELREAAELKNPKKLAEEFGDFLFALVNLARFLDVHPEEALQGTSNKFIRRFRHIEKRAQEGKRELKDMTLSQMDALWDEAKGMERP